LACKGREGKMQGKGYIHRRRASQFIYISESCTVRKEKGPPIASKLDVNIRDNRATLKTGNTPRRKTNLRENAIFGQLGWPKDLVCF
jgi:hypothetical protein